MGPPGDAVVEAASPQPAEYAFDVFILHAADDRDFVRGYLVPALNLPAQRVLVGDDLRLGAPIVSEIDRGVSCSRFTVVVLSPAYLRDRWAVFGEQLAIHLSVEDGHVIPLRLADVKLPLRIDARVALDFTDQARWDSEAARLRRLLHTAAPAAEPIPCPYPGMRPFAEHEATRFFGRDKEIDDLLERLDHGEREIYVIGPSGSGKSSLVQAGLLPVLNTGSSRLGRSFVVRTMRPGERPNERLAKALDGDLAVPPTTATFDRLLACHPPATRVLVIVDQLEELFTLAGAAERQRFIATLRALRAEPRCHFALTLRADFHAALLASGLAPHGADGSRIDVVPLRGATLAQAIVGPATQVGVHLERRLCDQLVADAATEPGALPHVQETLRLLWEKRRLRLLGLAEYELLGEGGRGLAVAIARRADATMRTLTAAQQAIARRLLLRLVVFGEGRADTRRQQTVRALRSATDDDAEFSRVLQRLVEARLITIDGDERIDDALVDLSHEALITAWPALRDWTARWRNDEQQRRRLETRTAEWIERGRGTTSLLDPVALSEAEQWMQSRAAQALGYGLELPALVAASQTELARAHRRRRRGTLWSLMVILAAALTAIIVLNLWRDARRRLQAQRFLEQGRVLVARHPMKALPYLVAARRQGIDRSEIGNLFAQAARAAPLATLVDHCAIVNSVMFSPDGTRLITRCDRTARVWDTATGAPLTVLEHDGTVTTAAFSPDGTRVVTASEDGTARVWNATTGKPVTPPLRHPLAVAAAVFSPDGTRVITTTGRNRQEPPSPVDPLPDAVTGAKDPGELDLDHSRDATRVWNAATGKLLIPPLEHPYAITAAMFSPDAARVVTMRDQGIAQVWDIVTGKPMVPLAYSYDITIAAFGPDGDQLITASATGIAQIWNVTTGKPATPLLKHQGIITALGFSPDGTKVVTASDDNTACVWNAVTGSPMTPLEHRDIVTAAVFSPDSRRVVTASADGTARVWDAVTSNPVTPPLEHGRRVTSAAFSPDGTLVATTADDGTTRVWDIAGTTLQHLQFVITAAFSPDGRRVVTASADGTARVWDAATGKPVTPPLEHYRSVTMVAFSPDGTRVVTASEDHTAREWGMEVDRRAARALASEASGLRRDEARAVRDVADRCARSAHRSHRRREAIETARGIAATIVKRAGQIAVYATLIE
jgi:WD40 repeat protein